MGAKGGGVPSVAQPTAARQLRLQDSAFGKVIPVGYGELRSAGNVLVAFRFRNSPAHNPPVPSSGKGGGRVTPNTFLYFVDCVLGIAEGALRGQSPTRRLNIGRAYPGNQAISVDDGVDPNGAGGKAQIQPLTGVDPGVYRSKRIRTLAPEGHNVIHGWRTMHWHDWAGSDPDTNGYYTSGVFLTRDGTVVRSVFNGAHLDQYIADFGDNFAGIACIAIQRWHLGSNASLPNMNFPVRLLEQYNDIYGLGADAVPIYDADPPCIILDAFTNPKHGGGWDKPVDALANSVRDHRRLLAGWPNPWGAGIAAGALTGPSKADSWSAFCRANNLLLSPFYDTQQPLSDVLKNMAEETNTAIVWSEGMLKMIPLADQPVGPSSRTGVTYTPTNDPDVYTTGLNIAIRANFTEKDFRPKKGKAPIEIETASVVPDHGSAGLFNDLSVEYEHRTNGYATDTAPAEDVASKADVGVISHDPYTLHEIKDPDLAAFVAQMLLHHLIIVRNIYRFRLGYEHILYEPMDRVSLTYAPMGLDHFPVRITSITEDKSGNLDVEAEELPEAFAGPPPPAPPTDFTGENTIPAVLVFGSLAGYGGDFGFVVPDNCPISVESLTMRLFLPTTADLPPPGTMVSVQLFKDSGSGPVGVSDPLELIANVDAMDTLDLTADGGVAASFVPGDILIVRVSWPPGEQLAGIVSLGYRTGGDFILLNRVPNVFPSTDRYDSPLGRIDSNIHLLTDAPNVIGQMWTPVPLALKNGSIHSPGAQTGEMQGFLGDASVGALFSFSSAAAARGAIALGAVPPAAVAELAATKFGFRLRGTSGFVETAVGYSTEGATSVYGSLLSIGTGPKTYGALNAFDSEGSTLHPERAQTPWNYAGTFRRVRCVLATSSAPGDTIITVRVRVDGVTVLTLPSVLNDQLVQLIVDDASSFHVEEGALIDIEMEGNSATQILGYFAIAFTPDGFDESGTTGRPFGDAFGDGF